MNRFITYPDAVSVSGVIEVVGILLLCSCILLLVSHTVEAAEAASPARCVLKTPIQPSTPKPDSNPEWVSQASLQQALGYILAAQARDGAIQVAAGQDRIVPYFANYAALGLVAGYKLGLGDQALQGAKRWIDWYAAHMDEHGYVHDYTGSYPLYIDSGKMDSTDSYAATFLALVWRYYQASGDRQYLAALVDPIRKAVQAMESTMNPDNLTWALPTYKVKYLMDNLEVWLGYMAAWHIADALSLSETATWAEWVVKTETAVKTKFVIPDLPYLAMSIGSSGKQSTRFDRLYPDALANLLYLAIIGNASNTFDQKLFGTVYDKFYESLPIDTSPAVHVWTAEAACVVGDVNAFAAITPLITDIGKHKGQAHSLGAVLRIAAALKGEPLWF